MAKETVLEIASATLLQPTGLSESQLESILGQIAGQGIDYADVYLQSAFLESWSLEDGIIKSGHFDSQQGVGVRVLSGEKTGLAYAEELMLPALQSAARAAKSIVLQGGGRSIRAAYQPSPRSSLYLPDNPLHSLSDREKVDILKKVNEEARKCDPRVTQVMATLAGQYEVVLVMASDGTFNADVRPLVRLSVSVIVEDNGKREQGSSGGGGRFSYPVFVDEKLVQRYAREAVRQAVVNLDAVPAPAGLMPVVLGSGWPGVLLHEAIGHGLEGDFNRKGSSAFSGRCGERVASSLCTIVDDGTLERRRGSLNMDDEGTATQCTVLIENGILKQYLQDKLNARLMGQTSTGNGRRESYAQPVIPRMTNTYMLPGKHTKEEIIASVDKGLYAANFGGGQVDITSGKFVFSASEAYLIEKGKITRPIKGATLIGDGPEVLKHVSMVGNDLALDAGVGTCGKEGQSVPVGVGQPTLKIDEMTVGGTQC